MKVGVISLGCDKNRIDTENMLSFLESDGYQLTGDASDADIIVVNTCAFIDSAKKEAIDTILEMAELKKNKCKCLVVSGCLPQRYMQDIKEFFPEIDILLGTGSYQKLPQLLREFFEQNNKIAIENDKDERNFSSERVLTTPYHYAYIKIAEGCDNKCTYCAIPSIRGKYTSRKIEDITQEASQLVKNYGITELIVVAQDVTKYGSDIYGKIALIELLKELSKLDIKWIRLLYLYPENVTDELLEYMASNDKICKYIDIPCQHISDKILKMMNRRTSKQQIYDLVARIRKFGDFSIRSTFIVGFPQEGQEEFDELKAFLEFANLDRCGFFAYSCEDGTPASRLKGQLPEEVKQARQKELYDIQNKIMSKKLRQRVGQTLDVIYEGIDYDLQLFYGRSQFDAPEIDTTIYFVSKEPVDIGKIYKVKINKIKNNDMYGEIL
ncbi:MAG: 30S ribosomal protein S12 methylthiotransferase RimO [Clostridia bacterium]